MFIGAQVFLQNLHSFRTCLLDGRYGGGKTLLSVALAKWMHETHGYHIYSNVPVFLDGVVDRLPKCSCKKCLGTYKEMHRVGVEKYIPQHHSVILYDEAWLSFGQGTPARQMREYLAYIRKVDLIMLMPSVLPMAKSACQIYCRRTFNAGVFGIPVWIYEWGVTGKTVKESGGKFALFRPSKFFGTYDTFAQPDIMDGLFGIDDDVDESQFVLDVLKEHGVEVD